MVNNKSRLNVSMVKDQSRKLIFQQILTQQKLTRNDIARNTNLSLGTVKSVFEEFIQEGILIEEKDTSRSVGRKPSFIKLLPDSKYICILSLTKDHFHCDVLNLQLESKFTFTFNYNDDEDLENSFNKFLTSVKEKISFIPEGHLLGFGISVPGPYFPESDQVICDLIPSLNELSLQKIMNSYFDVPVLIGNDVRLAALAASQQVRDLGNAPLFYVYLSEGVGGACIQDGTVFLGANHFAGEIGQIHLDDGKHFEEIVSWTSFLNRLGLNPDEDEKLLRENLLSRWKDNDPEMVKEINQLVDLLSKVLSYIVCIINPGNIVIGGKYKFLGQKFLDLLEDKLSVQLIKEHKRSLEISFSKENSRDPVLGAAMSVTGQWLESSLGN